MQFISLSAIIYLLFLSVDIVSGQPLGRLNGAAKSGIQPGTGHHAKKKPHPGMLFGFPHVKSLLPSDSNYQHILAQEFLAAHNWVRRRFNLPPYTWDEKLASYARQYAMQRYDDCSLVHSDGPYGENIFWGRRQRWTASDAVYFWFRENTWYDFQTLSCSSPKGEMCGHFTQIVWRDSLRLGCALQHCRNPRAGMLVVCEYDPPGNFDNENPLHYNNAKYAP